jgi:hypothetical protein
MVFDQDFYKSSWYGLICLEIQTEESGDLAHELNELGPSRLVCTAWVGQDSDMSDVSCD